MRLSDVRRRKTKPLYPNHSTPPDFTEAATRCSNRLLGIIVNNLVTADVNDDGMTFRLEPLSK
jgi:hypothetical protein